MVRTGTTQVREGCNWVFEEHDTEARNDAIKARALERVGLGVGIGGETEAEDEGGQSSGSAHGRAAWRGDRSALVRNAPKRARRAHRVRRGGRVGLRSPRTGGMIAAPDPRERGRHFSVDRSVEGYLSVIVPQQQGG